MLSQKTIAMWDGYVNQGAQEFMDLSREQGLDSIEAAVEAYVAELPSMMSDWDTSEREASDQIRAALVAYLEQTHGEEWDVEGLDA